MSTHDEEREWFMGWMVGFITGAGFAAIVFAGIKGFLG